MKEQSWYDQQMDDAASGKNPSLAKMLEDERERAERQKVGMFIQAVGTALTVVGTIGVVADAFLSSSKLGFWVALTILAEGVTTFMVGWAL